MIGVNKGALRSINPNLKLELKFNTNTYTDLAGTVGAGLNDYVRAWRSTVGGHLFTQATDAARPQRVSDGLYFDGGDKLTGTFTTPSTFTIECWANLSGSTAGPYSMMGTGLAASYNGAWGFDVYNTNFYLYLNGAGQIYSAYPTTNAWHHFAVCLSGGNQLKMFVDGVNTANQTYAFTPTMTSLAIGSDFEARLWPGKITDIRIYDVAKYTANFTPPTRSA